MRVAKIPFNIALVDSKKDSMLFSLFSVDVLNTFDNDTGDFHPRGLFSNAIFGQQGDEKRSTQHSFINLKAPIMHPFYLKILNGFKPLYREILLGTGYGIFDEKLKDFIRADPITGETGYAYFISKFNDLVFEVGGSIERRQRVKFLNENRDKAFMTKYIVIPAGLRDIEFSEDGRPVEDDLNPLYRKLISQVATVNTVTASVNDAVLDNARRSITMTGELIFSHIYDLIEGKRGFIQSKFASRKVFGTTRNVISAQEMGTENLNDIRAPRQDTTTVGLPQFMSGTQPKMRYRLREFVLKDFIDNLRGTVSVYDPKTLEKVEVTLPEKVSDKWGTDDGLNSIMGSFSNPVVRHKRVYVDGYCIGLLYNDGKGFKRIYDINEVPKDKRQFVTPLTWAEMFYLAAAPFVKEVRATNTRYPITTLGSTYPSRAYLKTTELSLYLHPYDDNWNLDKTNTDYVEFPNTEKKTAFHETMVVHSSNLPALGADKHQ